MKLQDKINEVNALANKVARPGMTVEQIEGLLPRVVGEDGYIYSYDAAVNAHTNVNFTKEDAIRRDAENAKRQKEYDGVDFSDAQD